MANSRGRIDPVYVDGKLHEVGKILGLIQDMIIEEAESNDHLKYMNRKLSEAKGNVAYLISIFESYVKHRA